MDEEVTTIYEVEGISKVFGDRYILNDVSFSIRKGEIFGIIGTSGSGKSTLLNTLVGFIKVDIGEIKFRNPGLLDIKEAGIARSIYKFPKELKKIYGFAAQNPSFYPNLTVRENLQYFGNLYNLSKEAIESNTNYLLGLVNLTQSQHVIANTLSGGMKRRLDIACSLIHDPKILFLDEPTADLDPVLAGKIWNLLRIINQRGTTIVLATHHIAELESVCSRVAIIKDGTILALGKPDEIKSKNLPGARLLIKSSPGDYDKITSALKKNLKNMIKQVEIRNDALIIHKKNDQTIMNEVLSIFQWNGEKIVSVETVRPGLDEAFVVMNKDMLEGEEKKNIKRPKKRRSKVKRKRK
jgi:ABC-2 type transport system ATP-binding protein